MNKTRSGLGLLSTSIILVLILIVTLKKFIFDLPSPQYNPPQVEIDTEYVYPPKYKKGDVVYIQGIVKGYIKDDGWIFDGEYNYYVEYYAPYDNRIQFRISQFEELMLSSNVDSDYLKISKNETDRK